MEKEQKLFEIFNTKTGLELYNAVKNLIEEEKVLSVRDQLSKRMKFEATMSNLWNNAGWDDEKDHSRKLDIIRKESNEIHEEVKKFGLEDSIYT